MDTKKGLPNTLYISNASLPDKEQKLYWFRRDQRSEMEGFVRALQLTNAAVDPGVVSYFLQVQCRSILSLVLHV